MYAIDVTSAASSLPTPAAPGTAGFFTDGNPLTATAATILPADFLNALMLELLNVVTAGGLTPSKTTNTQVRDAIKELIQQQTGNYALDTGSANAYVVAFSPVISAYTNGLAVRFKAAHANTGASTFNAGGGAVALVDDAGNALVSGAIGVGSLVTAVYDSIANAFFATSITTPVFNPSGQCQLSVSGGNLKLSPYQGNRLTINGAPQAIPSGGVSLGTGTVAAPVGLTQVSITSNLLTVQTSAAHGRTTGDQVWVNSSNLGAINGTATVVDSTHFTMPFVHANIVSGDTGNMGALYYIYAFMNSGTMTLEAAPIAHATDTTTGVEIKSGDPTRTLVGLAATIAGPAWSDSGQNALVASWFNPVSKTRQGVFTTQRSTASTTPVELNAEIRVQVVTFAGREIEARVSGEQSNTAAAYIGTQLNIDGAGQNESCSGTVAGAGAGMVLGIAARKALAEGFHFVSINGVVGSGTGNWAAAAFSSTSAPTTIDVSISG